MIWCGRQIIHGDGRFQDDSNGEDENLVKSGGLAGNCDFKV